MLSLDHREKSKSESAYQAIKDLILRERLTREDPLSVNLLASKLEMSKTPVREALKKLETEGFVRIIPNQGVVVCDLTVGEANYMYELRMALEGYLLRRVIPLITEEHISVLQDILEKQRHAMEQNDPYKFMEYDNDQHLYLHKIYYNPMIFDVINRLVDRIYFGGIHALRLPGRMNATLQEHMLIVDALAAHNVEEACQALEYHFTKGLSSTTASVEIHLMKKG
jgi:DNA-binding GntR family transcriptional regulator